MELNKEQTVKATELLGLLCKSNNLNKQVASFFDNDNEEAIFVCGVLKSKNLLRITPADGGIAGLDKNEETCNAFKNDTLMKEFIARDKLSKTTNIDLKIKRIELLKQYWWVAGIIFTIIGWILYVILF
jgi:hypothetical protein